MFKLCCCPRETTVGSEGGDITCSWNNGEYPATGSGNVISPHRYDSGASFPTPKLSCYMDNFDPIASCSGNPTSVDISKIGCQIFMLFSDIAPSSAFVAIYKDKPTSGGSLVTEGTYACVLSPNGRTHTIGMTLYIGFDLEVTLPSLVNILDDASEYWVTCAPVVDSGQTFLLARATSFNKTGVPLSLDGDSVRATNATDSLVLASFSNVANDYSHRATFTGT